MFVRRVFYGFDRKIEELVIKNKWKQLKMGIIIKLRFMIKINNKVKFKFFQENK